MGGVVSAISNLIDAFAEDAKLPKEIVKDLNNLANEIESDTFSLADDIVSNIDNIIETAEGDVFRIISRGEDIAEDIEQNIFGSYNKTQRNVFRTLRQGERDVTLTIDSFLDNSVETASQFQSNLFSTAQFAIFTGGSLSLLVIVGFGGRILGIAERVSEKFAD